MRRAASTLLAGTRATLSTAVQATAGALSAGAWLPVLRELPSHPPSCGGPRNDMDGREVGLSFDDGPTPETTPALIALLKEYRASATFFVTGERVERFPALVSALVEAGHTVFAHGWRHVPYAGEPESVLHDDMTRTEALLRRVRPTPEPYLVRLPYASGRRSACMHRAIRRWQPTAQLAFWRFGFDDFRLADGCWTESDIHLRCAAAAAPVLSRPDLPLAILLLHENPYDSIAPLAAAVAPVITRIILAGLSARGLVACRLRPIPEPPWIKRFVRG